MSIEARLNDDYKSAMRERATDRVACIRQLRSKIQEAVNAPDWKGEVDDGLYQRIIGSYVKSLVKGIDELAAAGDRGAPLRDKYRAEIDYLSGFLPKMLDESQTRALIRAQIDTLGLTSTKDVGRLMGVLMKEHKGQIDAAMAKRLATELLPAP